MTHTITIRGHNYVVATEPRLNGELAPHLYNGRNEVVGVLVEADGEPALVGAPKSWTRSDVQSAVQQILDSPWVSREPQATIVADLRKAAEAATAFRVRRDEEVDDQDATVIELSRQLRNAEAVLAELRSDRDEAVFAEETAWQTVELLDGRRD